MLNQTAIPAVNVNALTDPISGHGLWSTKWNGWFFFNYH